MYWCLGVIRLEIMIIFYLNFMRWTGYTLIDKSVS